MKEKIGRFLNLDWKTCMGWTYMFTCLFDFIIAPILWSAAQAYFNGDIQTQWSPLTIQGAGLFHISMGAILGISVYSQNGEHGRKHYDEFCEKVEKHNRKIERVSRENGSDDI